MMDIRLKQVVEVIRFITEKHKDCVIYGNWVCQNWYCKHNGDQCKNVKKCRNRCPHDPECQEDTECREKWQCKHEPTCEIREECQRKWTCRHNPVCQNKWFCRKNWRCQHEQKCNDIWECKYKWTEENEPRCHGIWECFHRSKCKTKSECQNKPFHLKWRCPHKCFNKWKCQHRWECQHKIECNMKQLDLKKSCQASCQHRCENITECLKKPQPEFGLPNPVFKDDWRCPHQCEDLRECQKKWKCPHRDLDQPECKDEWGCRSRWWRCTHTPACDKGLCNAKWDRENEQACPHIEENRKECQSTWQCLNDPYYKNKWQCQRSWRIAIDHDELEACLNDTYLLDDLYMQCNQCKNYSLITSFHLHPRNSSKLRSEIICHLVWVKARKRKGELYYRVFGEWKCEKKHEWDNSYTWIPLREYIDKVKYPNFSKIKCRICQKNGTITHWRRIEGSKDGPLHERELCEKCRSGELCIQRNSYFGRG